jgi:hypothetical protein
MTRDTLTAQGLPVPGALRLDRAAAAGRFRAGAYLLKPVREHGSVGLEEDCLIHADSSVGLRRLLAGKKRATRLSYYAERFIEGREFTVSIIESAGLAYVLPVAEMQFYGYPPDKPNILGYRAKWEAGSFEYGSTMRRQDFGKEDGELLAALSALAKRCWMVLRLSGYARVDFRVDGRGRPWIVDVNANPCLAADSGFAAAAGKADLPLERVWELLLQSALARRRSAAGRNRGKEASGAPGFFQRHLEQLQRSEFHRCFRHRCLVGAVRSRSARRRGFLSSGSPRPGSRPPSSADLDSRSGAHPRHFGRSAGQPGSGGPRAIRFGPLQKSHAVRLGQG